MKSNPKALQIILLTVLVLIWGSSFILMKRGLEVYTSSQVAAIRMVISFFCLLPFSIMHIKKIPASQWKYIIAAGLCGNGIPAFLFTKAETGLSSSIAGVLNTLTPVLTLITGVLFFKMKTTGTKVFGIFLGFIGAVCMILYNAKGDIDSNYFYGFYVLIACLFYSFSANIIKTHLGNINTIHLSGFALFAIGPPSAIYLFTTDFTTRVSSGHEAIISLIYTLLLGIFGTAIALVLFNKLLKTSTVLFASSVTYFIPAVAVLWGVLDGEKLGIMHLIGFLTILTGVYLINRKTYKITD
jgi:drug/metabolite transporter (DMT)-like permease